MECACLEGLRYHNRYTAFHMTKRSIGLLIGCAVLIVIGFPLGKYVMEHRVGYGAENYENTNIPPGFLFTDRGEIPERFQLSEDYQDIQQVGAMFSDQFYCSKLEKDADIVEYWHQKPGYGISGGWSYRLAAVCGDEYLVVYGADHLGEVFYGPFRMATLESPSLFGEVAMLSVGASLEFEDGLLMTLTEVNDSRCAEGVVCIWQGELSPVLELSGGDLDVPQTITLGTERTKNVTVVPYTVTLIGATESTVSFSVAKGVK